MLLLKTAIAFMLAAIVAMVAMFATGSTEALYACVASVVASWLCIYCENQLYKRKLYRQRLQQIANSAHIGSYDWRVKR